MFQKLLSLVIQSGKLIISITKLLTAKQKLIALCIFALFSVFTVKMVIPPVMESIRLSMAARAAETVVAESSRTYKASDKRADELNEVIEDATDQYFDAMRQKQCAQCRAYAARVEACNQGVDRLCDEAKESAQSIQSNYYGEIEYLCFSPLGNMPPCVPIEKYPGDNGLTLLEENKIDR